MVIGHQLKRPRIYAIATAVYHQSPASYRSPFRKRQTERRASRHPSFTTKRVRRGYKNYPHPKTTRTSIHSASRSHHRSHSFLAERLTSQGSSGRPTATYPSSSNNHICTRSRNKSTQKLPLPHPKRVDFGHTYTPITNVVPPAMYVVVHLYHEASAAGCSPQRTCTRHACSRQDKNKKTQRTAQTSMHPGER